ncbi:MAG: hypothetical protein AB7C97_00340 [Oscillospiraceae bacterium]
MMEGLKAWILSVAGAALIASVVLAVTPESPQKKAVRLVCGLLIITALLSVVPKFGADSFPRLIEEYRAEAEDNSAGVKDDNKRLLRLIMDEQCTTYISNEAKAAGIGNIEAVFDFSWSGDGYWYPVGVEIRTDAGENEKENLSKQIEADLGIEKARQSWSTYD